MSRPVNCGGGTETTSGRPAARTACNVRLSVTSILIWREQGDARFQPRFGPVLRVPVA
jgi:hypothetical protein